MGTKFFNCSGNRNGRIEYKLVQKWSSLIVTILLLVSTQLVFIGLIGEFLGEMFWETKKDHYISLKVQI